MLSSTPVLTLSRVPHRLLGQLVRQRFAVRLSRLVTLLSLCCIFDPLDQSRVTVSVLLQHRTQRLQIRPSGGDRRKRSEHPQTVQVESREDNDFLSSSPCLHLPADSSPPLCHLIGSLLVAIQFWAAVRVELAEL